MNPKRIIILIIALIIIILGWAPWLSAEDARTIVRTYPNFQEQHSAERGQNNPDIAVTWLPFCRWTSTYEGGWFVCFWETVPETSLQTSEPDSQTSTSSIPPSPATSSQSTPAQDLDPNTALLFDGGKKEEGTKLHISENLGVGFTYDPITDDSTPVVVTEKDNKIYMHLAGDEPGHDDQWVEVFSIEPAASIEEAITKKFLSGIDKKKCWVEEDAAEQGVPGYVAGQISYVSDPADGPGIIPEPCPQAYSKTNGKRYFLMNTKVPNKLLFVSIGQYVLTTDGTPKDPTKDFFGYDWAHSLRILK